MLMLNTIDMKEDLLQNNVIVMVEMNLVTLREIGVLNINTLPLNCVELESIKKWSDVSKPD
jgi:hypothetical protein